MAHSSEPITRSLLAVSGASGCWAFPSASVLSVELPSDTPGAEPPPDLAALLGVVSSSAEEEARVLVVRAECGQHRVGVRGSLKLLDGGSVQLLTLPREVHAVSPLISHIAVVDGKPSLLVVSPERLLESLRSGSPVPPRSPETV